MSLQPAWNGLARGTGGSNIVVGTRHSRGVTPVPASFAHGGNDAQKGMGLIMLILIGVAPTAYALNHTMPDANTPAFLEITN
jgi:phosphate/sulfate permease